MTDQQKDLPKLQLVDQVVQQAKDELKKDIKRSSNENKVISSLKRWRLNTSKLRKPNKAEKVGKKSLSKKKKRHQQKSKKARQHISKKFHQPKLKKTKQPRKTKQIKNAHLMRKSLGVLTIYLHNGR